MKKSTLIKLVKEELTKKSLLKEFNTTEIERIGKLRGTLAGLIHYADNKSLEPQWLLNKISEIITKALEEDSKLGGNTNSVNENEKGTLTKSELITKLQALGKEDPTQRVRIPKVHVSGAYDKTGARLVATPEQALAFLQKADEGEFTQDKNDETAFSLVQSKDDQKNLERLVRSMGSLD